MRRVGFSKKANSLDSLRNRTTTFGIMGGTITSGNYRNSIRTATYRATTYNQIPPRPNPGKEYMLAHNLLSRNPQCSGGVGRTHTHPGACGPCNCVGSDYKESKKPQGDVKKICQEAGGTWGPSLGGGVCRFAYADSLVADSVALTYVWQKKMCGYRHCRDSKCLSNQNACIPTSDSVLLCHSEGFPLTTLHTLYGPCCSDSEILQGWKKGTVCISSHPSATTWTTNLDSSCKGTEKTYCISKEARDSVSGIGNPDSLPTLFSKCDSTVISNWWEIECT